MTASSAPARDALILMEPGFAAVLRSEWTKLRSVRSTWIMVALGIGLSIGSSALIALVTGLTFDSWDNATRAAFDPVITPMSGWLFGIVLLAVLGATAVTSEYSSGMIQTTFIGTPRRGSVLAAKAIVVAAIALATSSIIALGMFLASQPIYAYYGIETASITDGDASRAVIASALAHGLIYTLIPFSIAWLLRGVASTLTATFGFLLLPTILGSLVPRWVQENLLRYLPDISANSLIGLTESDAATYQDTLPAIVAIATWLIVALAASTIVLTRRDV